MALYDEALPTVFGYLLSRCGSVTVAEDLTSETFLAAVTAVRNGPAPLSVPWVVGIARHKLVDHWRAKGREDARLALVSAQPDVDDDPWDVRLDALLKLRSELNGALSGRGVKLSVNDLLIKALGVALEASPKCNVTFAGDKLISYKRADVSVAVSTPSGLITPIIRDAANKSVSAISTEMKELGGRAKENKLKPEEYQGGTASLSNMGMFGIKQFEAVINPPQAMIMAIGAGEKRPYVVDDALSVATVMSATGSFDHRAIDGADGAQLMKVFKELCEKPLGLVA